MKFVFSMIFLFGVNSFGKNCKCDYKLLENEKYDVEEISKTCSGTAKINDYMGQNDASCYRAAAGSAKANCSGYSNFETVSAYETKRSHSSGHSQWFTHCAATVVGYKKKKVLRDRDERKELECEKIDRCVDNEAEDSECHEELSNLYSKKC